MMSFDERQYLRTATYKLKAAETLFKEAFKALSEAAADIERIQKSSLTCGHSRLPNPSDLPTDHLREHRMGRPAKIDSDPELNAFLHARMDRMTFDEMARDVAKHFTPDRRISKSSIHRWWSKTKD